MFDVAIIGGGVIGCAVAYKLSRFRLNVILLEKENDVAMGATRANSAIIHAGYDPKPGTLMARLNVDGCAQAAEICKKLSVPYKNTGSFVLAFSQEEAQTVRELYEQGIANGVPGIKIVDAAFVREREPYVSDQVISALYAPSAGIVNPWAYALAMGETAAVNGTQISLNTRVDSITQTQNGWSIQAGDKNYEARFVVNAAGVHSDEIHNLVAAPTFRILPSKGQYYLMDKAEGNKANAVLFQCPSSVGKGVLVAPTVHGNLIVGPDATDTEEKDRTNTTGEQLAFVRQTAAKTVPDIAYRNAIRNFAGVRANSDQSDFIISFAAPGFLDLAGIKSPGLSAAPAIGDEAVKMLSDAGLALQEKENFIDSREQVFFKELTDEQKTEIIRKDPLFGRVVCRCETITEGEIVRALHAPIPATTVDGVKRRCNAGMGRCQGGFCGPRVLEIISREWGISPLDVLKDKNGSHILVSETKEDEAHV